MSINEVFPNPTVKKVIFQIKFPNLFFIEKRIGEFQLKIMNEFPESSLLFRRQVVFVDTGPEGKLENIPAELDNEKGKKIWQFTSPKGYKLNVLSDSLDITSEFHKTYNNHQSDNRFRDIIKLVFDSFSEIVAVPIKISRIGLRYIDECPIVSKNNRSFRLYYNSVFPLSRFNLSDAEEMDFKTVVRKGDYFLRYVESIRKIDEENKLILDFDAYAVDVTSENCLAATDTLHDLILEEYVKTIKEPVYRYMRRRG